MSTGPIHVDADITRAETLPGFAYRDPSVFEAQRERVFVPSWQFVGDKNLISAPGQVHPFTLLEGCLDEPLLLSRDFEDRIHCLSNVCTHRSNIVVEGPGHERHLRCRYHGRRFALDGRFEFMPEFAGVEGFPCEKDNLAHAALEAWGPLLFVSIKPAVSLHSILEPVRSRLAWLPLEEFRHDPGRSRDYLVQANWALYCDNYLEGFHILCVGCNETLGRRWGGTGSSRARRRSHRRSGAARRAFALLRSRPIFTDARAGGASFSPVDGAFTRRECAAAVKQDHLPAAPTRPGADSAGVPPNLSG